MGKTAEPNTPYCTGFPSGSLSVGGTVYATDNPPISYTLAGFVATISDNGGVIGTEDLSGALVVGASTAALPNTNYCSGQPKARLRWNLGQLETTNTPINYSLIQPPTGIQVDWGGGDVVTLTGTSWTITQTQIGSWFLSFQNVAQLSGNVCQIRSERWQVMVGANFNSNIGTTYPGFPSVVNTPDRAGDPNSPPSIVETYPTPICTIAGVPEPIRNLTISWVDTTATPQSRFFLNVRQATQYSLEYRAQAGNIYTVTTNTGQFSSRTQIEAPIVTALSGSSIYQLTINDANGQIGFYEYTTEPIDFIADCYRYDIREVSYACKGECPAGTKFQCVCPADNALYCYGFSSPDVFEPLFTTQIVG